MRPGQAILEQLPVASLRRLVAALDVDCGDRRSRAGLADALSRSRSATVIRMIDELRLAELKIVAGACCLPTRGNKAEIVARLHTAPGVRRVTKRSRAARVESDDEPFVAIDFETADRGRDSACAVALVRVEDSRIVGREVRLIRPPRRTFEFTYIHGITWPTVAREPTFGELWPELEPFLDGASFLAAHNASFDSSVLRACCQAAGLPVPAVPFRCTVALARSVWQIRPTKLPDVCRHLHIPLQHHDPASDAEACARIVIAARG